MISSIHFDLTYEMGVCRYNIRKLQGVFYDMPLLSNAPIVPQDVPAENILIISGSLDKEHPSPDRLLMWCRDPYGTWYIPDDLYTAKQYQFLYMVLKRIREILKMENSRELIKMFMQEFTKFSKEHHTDLIRISQEGEAG